MRRLLPLALAGCSGPDDPHVDPPAPPLVEPTTCAPVDVLELEARPITEPVGIALDLTLADSAIAQVACTLVTAPPLWRQWVPFGASWRYLEAEPPSDWALPTFDDVQWSVGTAPFSAGDEGETMLAGAERTVYFRTTFEAAPLAVLELAGAVRRDDGIVVYLDGVEVWRDNLPEGPISDEATALGEIAAAGELRLVDFVPARSAFGSSPHVVAVELHPFGSEDLSFDLRLAALVEEPVTPEMHVAEFGVPATTATLTVLGLIPDAEYACVASSECEGEERMTEVTTPALGVPPPVLATRPGSTPSWGAYTLFNHQRPCPDEFTNRLYVVDPDGRVRWHRELGIDVRSSIDIEAALLDDGTILWGGSDQPEGRPQILSLDHTVLHDAGYPGFETDIYHHDVSWLDGEILGIVNRDVTGGALTTEGFGLVAYDAATQTVNWSWDAQTAVDRGQLPAPTVVDPYHANSLAAVVDAEGAAVYVTLLTSDVVVRVDRTTGDLTWAVGRGGDFALVDAGGAPLTDDAWFRVVHAIEVHGDRILLYENGRDVERSQIMELALDVPARVATLLWTWTEASWFEPVWGDVDELPNGNVLVAMAHNHCFGGNDSHPGALVEVERPGGNVPWRLDFLDVDDSMYRAQRIDGCAVFANTRFCPALAEETP